MKIKRRNYSFEKHKGNRSKVLEKIEITFFRPSVSFFKNWLYWKFLSLKAFINGPDFYRTKMNIRRWEFWKWKREAKLRRRDCEITWEDLLKKVEKVEKLTREVLDLRKKLRKLNDSKI